MLIAAEVGAALVTARSGKQATVMLGDLAMCVGWRQSVRPFRLAAVQHTACFGLHADMRMSMLHAACA